MPNIIEMTVQAELDRVEDHPTKTSAEAYRELFTGLWDGLAEAVFRAADDRRAASVNAVDEVGLKPKEHGLSVGEIADALGIPINMVTAIRRGFEITDKRVRAVQAQYEEPHPFLSDLVEGDAR